MQKNNLILTTITKFIYFLLLYILTFYDYLFLFFFKIDIEMYIIFEYLNIYNIPLILTVTILYCTQLFYIYIH